MKNFDQLCKSIDWKKMEKARISVRSLSTNKKTLAYLVEFLNALADSATDVHGVSHSEVHYRSMLSVKASKQKN